jgi:hypothetical protein
MIHKFISKHIPRDARYWKNKHESFFHTDLPLKNPTTIQNAINEVGDGKISYSELIQFCRKMYFAELQSEIEFITPELGEKIAKASEQMKAFIARDDLRKDKIEQKAAAYITQSALVVSVSTLLITLVSDKINVKEVDICWMFIFLFLFILSIGSYILSIISATLAHRPIGMVRIQPKNIIKLLTDGEIPAKIEALKSEYPAYHANSYSIQAKAKSQLLASRFFAIGLCSTFIVIALSVIILLIFPKSTSATITPQNITNNYSLFGK